MPVIGHFVPYDPSVLSFVEYLADGERDINTFIDGWTADTRVFHRTTISAVERAELITSLSADAQCCQFAGCCASR